MARLRNLIRGIKRSIGIIQNLLHSSICTRLSSETGFGLDDYAATGLLTGLIWRAKGCSFHLSAFPRIRLAESGSPHGSPVLSGSRCYASNLDSILETSVGNIRTCGLELEPCGLFEMRTIGKGRRYAEQHPIE